MRAAMITGYQQPLDIVSLPDPELPKDGIIMRVRATGVCRMHRLFGHFGSWQKRTNTFILLYSPGDIWL